MDGLKRNVAISCPMACERFTARVRSTGTMGKNDDWIFAGNHRVEDSNSHILVTLVVMEHQTCHFNYCQRPSFEFVAVLFFFGQRWQRGGRKFFNGRARWGDGRLPRGIRDGESGAARLPGDHQSSD